MYQVQKQKGITLIALVITIIILIILAGVGINLAIGENGLIQRAKQAQEQSIKEGIREEIEETILNIQVEEVAETGKLTLERVYEELPTRNTNIILNEMAEGDTSITGTYTKDGKTYSFTINGEFKVTVEGETEEEIVPVQTESMVWNVDGTVTLNLSSKISDSIEYQVNGTDGTWIPGSQVTGLQPGDKVYVRVNDGTTITQAQEIEIKDEIDPEEFTITVPEDSITYEALKVSSTGTVDNQTGIKNYSFVAASNGIVVKEIKDQTVTEYLIEGLSPETEYVVYMLAYDNAGNVRKSNEVTMTTPEIPVERIKGQYVNYEIDLNDNGSTKDDWIIFYQEDDETNLNYGATYIIPDYYVPYLKMETSISNAGMILKSGTYQVNWSSAPTSFVKMSNYDEIKRIFMYDYTGETNENVYCVSRLLYTDYWKDDFVTLELQEKGGMAIGGPTINMWCASWNKAYPTEKITATMNGTGYLLNGSNYVDLAAYTGYKTDAPNVYFPTKSGDSDGTEDYWLASPNCYHARRLFICSIWGSLGSGSFSGSSRGLRPVVFLPPSVTLTPDATTPNLWNINY